MSIYTPHTDSDVKEMLDTIGVESIDDLYSNIDKSIYKLPLDLPQGLPQAEVEKQLKALAKNNVTFDIILRGNGSYHHYIPAVTRKLYDRSEFITAYTPYQAELNQGILQSIFEYQTMVCQLTNMDVTNASHYDGATASAEAVLMCLEKKKQTLVVAPFVKSENIDVIKTYCPNINIVTAPHNNGVVDLEKLEETITSDVFAFYLEQPNCVGCIELADKIGSILNAKKIKYIINNYPIALGLIKKPKECGADIAVAEGQPLGLEMAFGGPYLGIIATTKALQRKLPGRIVGKTVDDKNNPVYVLTLQAREQHIRREKASSNICSNQALCALRTGMYLVTMGEEGLQNVATACVNNAHYLASELEKIGLVKKYSSEFFNEFVTTSNTKSSIILEKLKENGVLGGQPLNDNDILWCATEMQNKQELDFVVSLIKEVLC